MAEKRARAVTFAEGKLIKLKFNVQEDIVLFLFSNIFKSKVNS